MNNPSVVAENGDQLLEPFCWGLDPLFWTHVKLFASQIYALISAPRIEDSHFLRIGDGPARPIVRVEVIGTVVRIQPIRIGCVYTLDDGTGFLRCCYFSGQVDDEQDLLPWDTIELGVTLQIRGKLKIEKEMYTERDVLLKGVRGPHRSIVVESMRVVTNPNEELCAWAETINLCRHEYCKEAKTITMHAKQSMEKRLEEEVQGSDLYS